MWDEESKVVPVMMAGAGEDDRPSHGDLAEEERRVIPGVVVVVDSMEVLHTRSFRDDDRRRLTGLSQVFHSFRRGPDTKLAGTSVDLKGLSHVGVPGVLGSETSKSSSHDGVRGVFGKGASRAMLQLEVSEIGVLVKS